MACKSLLPDTCNLSVHVLKEEHHAIGRAAWAQGLTISGWIRNVAFSALEPEVQARLIAMREEREKLLKIAEAGRRSRHRSRSTAGLARVKTTAEPPA